jgi:hypothetical protein
MKIKLLACAVLFLLVASSVWAQSAAGVAAISGVVRDASGGAVPNAKVVISSDTRGELRSITTNVSGIFAAPALIPGPGYNVTVTASGFATWEVKDVDLRVGQNLTLTANLAIARSATQVEVVGTPPLVDSTKTDVSQVVGTRDIQDLPINGRRVDSFVLNTPGVTNDATFGLLTFRGVAGNNSFLLDGNDNTEQFYDENAGRTRIQSQVSADAVQEFEVVSANFSAEYGRAMGGVVNTVTKSGGNDIHGSAFYFLRSTGFDAHDPYSAFNPTEHRIQTGGTVGGAIIKNKLFYFLSADITRRNFPFVDSQVKVGFVDPGNQVWVGCGAPATPAQCSAINALLPRFYGQIPRTASNDLYFGRIDYNLNDKNTFSSSFNFLRWKSPNGIQTGLSSTTGAGITGNGDDSVSVRNGKATWTFVPNSRLVNSFRYGLDTDRQADGFDQAELGGGLGYLDVAVAGVQLGPATYLPRVEPLEVRNEFADDVSYAKGKHMIKFGMTFEHVQDDVNYLSNRYGSYTYPTVTSFAQDYSGNTAGLHSYSAFTQTFGNPIVNYAIQDVGFYVQDQWKVTDKLTFTYGIRYEHTFDPPPPTANPAYPLTGANLHTGGNFNLMPRIGIAYQLNSKTVIRGGLGTFYARLVAGMLDDIYTGNGIYQISDSLSNAGLIAQGPKFPNALPSPLTTITQGASTLDVVSPKLKTPYSEQATISVERALAKDMVLTVSGIFSRGVNIWGTQDINAPGLGAPFTYNISGGPAGVPSTYTTQVYTGARPNPAFGAIYEQTNGVSSAYNALVASFNKRFAHGFQASASYTWSHEIDDGQGAATNAIFGFSDAAWTYNGNYGFDKGSGGLDQRQRFVYTFVWAPVFTHSNSAFAKYVVNNWQLSSITTIQSGRPQTLTIHMNDTPVTGMLYSADALDGFNGNFRVPFLPVNSLYSPWVQQENFRLTKSIPLPRESMRLSLNFEAFNIANNWSPTALTTQAYTEAKGVLTYTPTAYGVGTSDGGFPDGTQARRLQVSARFVF